MKKWQKKYFYNYKTESCFYCGTVKPKIKRLAPNMNKIFIYYKHENDMWSKSKSKKSVKFHQSNIYSSNINVSGHEEKPSNTLKGIGVNFLRFILQRAHN